MKKHLCSLLILLATIGGFAQEASVLTLKVTDAQGQPLPAVTVELRRGIDSSLLKIQLTGPDGSVLFEGLQPDRYFARLSHAGFAPSTTKLIPFTGGRLVADAVALQPTAAALTGVTVTARRPFIEIKPGKTVVNLEAGITDAGTTALEALEKMPGVTVDKDGNISLKGRSGVTVMIDGKQTFLDATQLATLLGGMNSAQISQVELMDQPGAAFDAAGNAGIINIKLKKNQQRGFNGSFSTGYAQGVYPKNNNSLQLNYRSGKWNLFANYSVNVNTNFSRIYAIRTFYKPDGSATSLLEQPSYFRGQGNTHNLRTGVDYTLSNKTSLGLTLTGLSLGRTGTTNNRADWMQVNKQIDSVIRTTGNNRSQWQNAGASLNFRHQFTADRELTADVDALGYRIRGDQFFENSSDFPIAYKEAIQASLPSDLTILSAKTDYAEQVKSVRLTAGLKASHITTDNLAAYETKEAGSDWKPDYGRTNHFLYDERIKAAYANAETKWARWSLQAGLRYEATAYDARQLGNPVQKDSSFSRSYDGFFPTLMASFEADSNHSFSVSAGRRIDRPAFQQLNPFVQIINKYTYQQGNPFYRPQYTWNMELSHVYKNRIVTGFGYSVTTDYFSQIFPLAANGLVIYTVGNLGRLQQFTLSVSGQFSLAKWWSLSAQAVAVHKEMEGFIGRQLQASVNQLTLNMNNQLRFGKGWSGEVTGFYTSRSQADIQEIVDPAGQLSAGIARSIWKNKGTLRLAVRDILYTQWMKGDTYLPQAHEYFKITRDTRVVQVGFTYRFGKTFKTNTRSEGSAKDEIQRVGNG